jgi:hypothetical protein
MMRGNKEKDNWHFGWDEQGPGWSKGRAAQGSGIEERAHRQGLVAQLGAR